MKLTNKTIIAIILFYGTISFAQTTNSYEVIYSAGKEGQVKSGGREELVEYVNNGNPIRVGWDLHMRVKDSVYTMTHWVDAGFITILDGHVFAQIKSIYGQGPGFPTEGQLPSVFLSNAEPDGWVAIIGTTGVMRQKFKRDQKMIEMLSKTMNEKEIEDFLKRQETMNVPTKWAVLVK